MLVELSFGGLALIGLAAALYGAKRYRTPLNPLTVFVVTQIGLLTLVSGLVAYRLLSMDPYTPADMAFTTVVAGVYLLGAVSAYTFRVTGLVNLFGQAIGALGLGSETVATQFSSVKLTLLLGGAVAAFAALAVLGGGGMLWLTDSRSAYISYRVGVGPFFALSQWSLVFALLYCLWASRPRLLKLLVILTFFSALVYFLGSKSYILIMVIIGIVYYNFCIKRISLGVLTVLGALLFLSVPGLLVAQGSFGIFSKAIIYFADYFNTTAQFLAGFDEFGFLYGQGWLSNFWFYVPRGLYPDKPFEYGVTLIHQSLFPGMAELGHTPGILPWALAYLDFGVVGVFLNGLAVALWQRLTYEHFLKHRQSFFAFVFMMQWSFWPPVMAFAPLAIVVIWCMGLSIFFRLRLLVCRPSFEGSPLHIRAPKNSTTG